MFIISEALIIFLPELLDLLKLHILMLLQRLTAEGKVFALRFSQKNHHDYY